MHVYLEKIPQQYDPNPNPDPAFLGHLPSLSVLRLGRMPNAKEFLQFLCSREPHDPTKYYCPNLTEIHLLRASAAPPSMTEQERDAAKQLLEKRPSIVLYDGEGQQFCSPFL